MPSDPTRISTERRIFMQGLTQAAVFISTLEDLLVAERKNRRVRPLSQHKAHAARYLQSYPPDPDDGRSHAHSYAQSTERQEESVWRSW